MPGTQPTAKEINGALLNMFENGMQKEAQDAVTDFIRMRMREEGFTRQIIPPVQVTDDDLDKQVDTDKPVIICEKEPDSPAAISVPFGTLPINRYIRGIRFRVMFQRIMSPRFVKDVNELRTYDQDIRQILSDNALKDMQAEEDGKFIATVDTILLGPGMTVPDTGVVPFSSQFYVTLSNLTAQDRRAAAKIDAVIGNGNSYSNWKSGWTNLGDSEVFATDWSQNIPALGSVIGSNVFTLVAEDVTPPPFNQPPYSPSGDTATDSCVVTATMP